MSGWSFYRNGEMTENGGGGHLKMGGGGRQTTSAHYGNWYADKTHGYWSYHSTKGLLTNLASNIEQI